MGGVYTSNLVESVTHLICGGVRSVKYDVSKILSNIWFCIKAFSVIIIISYYYRFSFKILQLNNCYTIFYCEWTRPNVYSLTF